MKTYHLLPVLLLCILLLARCTREEADTSPVENFTDEALNISYTYPAVGNKQLQNTGITTAGEWNDLANWHLWTPQLKKGSGRLVQEKWNFILQNRFTLILTDSLNKAIPDARIYLETSQGTLLDESRTDNTGLCYLFPATSTKSEDLRLKIVYADQVFYIGDLKPLYGLIEKQLNIQRKVSSQLDILFVANTSSAMADELKYLQTALKDILSKVKNQSAPELGISIGSVLYGNYSSTSFMHSFPLTSHTNQVLSPITGQASITKADSLEAIGLALEEAVYRQNWSKEATSRIVFLILDTPLHSTPAIINRIIRVSREAARQGIRIIPIVTGSMNISGELLMRSLAIRTNGTYIFFTRNLENAISNPVSTIGTYTDEPLNNLILRLLVKYSKLK